MKDYEKLTQDELLHAQGHFLAIEEINCLVKIFHSG